MQEGGGWGGGRDGGRLSKFSAPAKGWSGRVVGWGWEQLRLTQQNGIEKLSSA